VAGSDKCVAVVESCNLPSPGDRLKIDQFSRSPGKTSCLPDIGCRTSISSSALFAHPSLCATLLHSSSGSRDGT